MNIKSVVSLGKTIAPIAKNPRYFEQIRETRLDRLSRILFRQADEPKSSFLAILKNFESSGLEMPAEVREALKLLKERATMFADRMENAISCGKDPVKKDYYKEFQRTNADLFKKVTDFLEIKLKGSYETQEFKDAWELKKSLYRPEQLKTHVDIMYCGKIVPTNPKIFSEEDVFYHGTKHEHKIRKNGFKTEKGFIQELLGISRDLGDGVYLTPEKDVAAYFAGIEGGIVKASVHDIRSASVNNRQRVLMSDEILEEFGGNADVDSVIKKLFLINGYNAAYSRQGSGKINSIIGKNQAQLAVYENDRISILPKTFSERLQDLKLQLKVRLKSFRNTKNI